VVRSWLCVPSGSSAGSGRGVSLRDIAWIPKEQCFLTVIQTARPVNNLDGPGPTSPTNDRSGFFLRPGAVRPGPTQEGGGVRG